MASPCLFQLLEGTMSLAQGPCLHGDSPRDSLALVLVPSSQPCIHTGESSALLRVQVGPAWITQAPSHLKTPPVVTRAQSLVPCESHVSGLRH